MKITTKWLNEKHACKEGISWFKNQNETNTSKLARKLLKEDHFVWASWLLTQAFTKNQRVAYAVYAAKKVLGIYEAKHPDDDRPRKAIEAAERFLESGDTTGLVAANAAANAYAAAANTAAANAAANAAAYAADAACATYSSYAAAYARREMQSKIIEYGIKLIEGDKNAK